LIEAAQIEQVATESGIQIGSWAAAFSPLDWDLPR
jgi:hypothetical protein